MPEPTVTPSPEPKNDELAFLAEANQQGRVTVIDPDDFFSREGAEIDSRDGAVVVLRSPTPIRAVKHRRGQNRPLNSAGVQPRPEFEGGEHTAIGDSILLFLGAGDPGTVAGRMKLAMPSGLALTYGQIVSLGGDFYGFPDSPISDGPTQQDRVTRFLNSFNSLAGNPASIAESAKILQIMQTEITAVNQALYDGKPASAVYEALGDELSGQWNVATGGGYIVSPWIPPGRYLNLAQTNWDHFGTHAVLAYQAGHMAALNQAIFAHNSPPNQQVAQLQIAYAMNAFADHFFSDLFSSGHMRTPRKELYDIVTDPVTGSMLARFMHDEDSLYGLNVSNAQAISWKAYGDKRYFDTVDNQNKNFVDQTLQVSAGEVFDTFLSGSLPTSDPNNYAALQRMVNLQQVANYTDYARNTSPLFIKDSAGVWPRKDYNNLDDHEWPHDYWTGPTFLSRLKAFYDPPYPLKGRVSAPASAPAFGGWNSSTQTPPYWMQGNSVRYAVSYLQGTGESDLGPWTPWWQFPNQFEPTLANIPVDPARLATGRRIYRQFALSDGRRILPVPIATIMDNSTIRYADTTQNNQIWEQVPGALSCVATSRDGFVWGVNSGGNIYRYVGGVSAWQQIPGGLSQVSVGFNEQVWGVNSGGNISYYRGGGAWQQVPGTLSQVSVGKSPDQIWGVNSNGNIYHYIGGAQVWQQIPGGLSWISAGPFGSVWGVNSGGAIYKYVGGQQVWSQVPGPLMKQISVCDENHVWAVGQDGRVYKYLFAAGWLAVPGTMNQVAVSESDVWGVDPSGNIFNFPDLSEPRKPLAMEANA
jgi:hypothetical protein